jgi:NAD+-dependent secondary alcohol dehydrogenase Adh1
MAMKAARLFSYDKPLRVVDTDRPRLSGTKDVLVQVTGAGVCHTDLHIVEGVWREKVQVTLPYTLGHENAGLVAEVGEAVTSFRKGDKVILHPVLSDGLCRPCRIGEDMHCENLVFPGITADGGFAEYLRTSERSLVPIHDLDPADVAPLADAGLTAIRAVKKTASRTTSGSEVVVQGVGGLGHIALQLLRCMTNTMVTAVDVVESKLRLAEKMGAHRVVDARRDPVKQVMDITAKRGADVVIDLVGNDQTLANGVKMLRKGGTLIIVGYGGTVSVKAIDMIFSEYSVVGSLVGNWDELRELIELTRQKKVRVLAKKGKLDEVNDFLDQLKKGTLEGRGVVIP